ESLIRQDAVVKIRSSVQDSEKKDTSNLSKSFTGATIEVSKRGQHLLSQMRASHSSLRYGLQSWQSPHYGLGEPSPGEAEARLWWPEIPRTKANCQNDEKVSREIEMPNL